MCDANSNVQNVYNVDNNNKCELHAGQNNLVAFMEDTLRRVIVHGELVSTAAAGMRRECPVRGKFTLHAMRQFRLVS